MTDWQQPLMVLLTQANGMSVLHGVHHIERGYHRHSTSSRPSDCGSPGRPRKSLTSRQDRLGKGGMKTWVT
jgi:UDP-N-acetylglucosamine enolpyruvyl transferase